MLGRKEVCHGGIRKRKAVFVKYPLKAGGACGVWGHVEPKLSGDCV